MYKMRCNIKADTEKQVLVSRNTFSANVWKVINFTKKVNIYRAFVHAIQTLSILFIYLFFFDFVYLNLWWNIDLTLSVRPLPNVLIPRNSKRNCAKAMTLSVNVSILIGFLWNFKAKHLRQSSHLENKSQVCVQHNIIGTALSYLQLCSFVYIY